MCDIFESKLIQKEETIDATQLYEDINNFIENKIKNENVDLENVKLNRSHPLQHILNSTSGNYISPTSMKSFESCPAGYLYNKLIEDKAGTATSVGTSVHSIFCEFYNSNDRSIENINKITEKIIKEDGQTLKEKDIKNYINGYLEAGDYLGGKMNHEGLICSNEFFIKTDCKPLGVSLQVPIYTLIDRIDIRENGIYIIDYKTGWGNPNPYLLGENGYLPQMIFYKWAVESEFDQKINNAYLCLPGADFNNKYVEMNVNSLVEQSKVIEKCLYHTEHIRKTRENKIFEESLMRYCNSCNFKMRCNKYRKSKNMDVDDLFEIIPVKLEITENLFLNKDKETEE